MGARGRLPGPSRDDGEGMIRTYAAFLQNTIDPMLDKLGAILSMCSEKGLPVDRDSLSNLLEKLFLAHIVTVLVKCITGIIVAGVICWTALQLQ